MSSLSILRQLYLALLLSEALHPALSDFRDINDLAEARLMRDLDFDGRVAVRPAPVYSKTINVSISFNLHHVKGLDIAKQELSLKGSFYVVWNDPFLAWDPAKYDNITATKMPAHSIWTPLFIIENSLDGQKSDDDDWKRGNLHILSSGTIIWTPTGIYNMACEVDSVSFPFDKQTCNMSLMPVGTTDAEYSMRAFSHSRSGVESLEWTVLYQDATTKTLRFGTTSISNAVFSLTLKRQSTYHVLTVIVPGIVLYIVGLMVFALPADSGEKVSLCVACLMSYFFTQLIISEQIPKSWNSVPVIMVFSTAFMLLNVLSVCCTVLVLNLHHRKSPIPGWLQRLLAAHHRLWYKEHNASQDTAGQVKAITEDVTDNPISQGKVDEIGNVRNVKDGDGTHRKWAEVAEVVNTVSCGIYILSAVVMGFVFITMWAQG